MTAAQYYVYTHILGSFSYLHVPQKTDTDPTSPLTIILYPDLEEDYADFVTAYTRKKGKNKPKLMEKESKSLETRKKLRNFCEQLLNAKQYEYGDMKIHHKLNASSDDIPSAETAQYLTAKITIGDFSEYVPLFPCFEEDDGTRFFMTYGFTEDYAFIFKHQGRKSKVVLFGLAEPTPIFDVTFRNRRHLEKVFAQAHRMAKQKVPNVHPICTLNGNQKLRLCSLVDNARSALAQEVPPTFGKRLKIERIQELECEEKVEVIFHELDTYQTYHHMKSVEVTSFPCFITRYQKVVVDFLVAEDPSNKESVFLLERIEHIRTGKLEVIVVGRALEIALLKHANDFF